MTTTANTLNAREPFDRAAHTEPHAYRAHAGTDFFVDAPHGQVALRLDRVSDERVTGGFRQYSLYFHGPPAQLLPQGIYLFTHDTLGALALFIVPVLGSNHERIVYEACFNQRVNSGGAVVQGGAA